MIRRKRSSAIAEKLRELKHAVPFLPFRVKTVAGETLTVTGADTFMVSPRGMTAILFPKEDRSFHLLQLHEVLTLEPAPNAGKRGNRQSHRRKDQ